jgi:hypothetical protein
MYGNNSQLPSIMEDKDKQALKRQKQLQKVCIYIYIYIYIYIFPILKPLNNHGLYHKPTEVTIKSPSFNCSTKESLSKFPNTTLSYLWGDHKIAKNHQNKSPGSRYCKQMVTTKCGIDRWVCLKLVITNTTEYFLCGFTAVFVLRIVQWKNTQYGPNADMLNVRYI